MPIYNLTSVIFPENPTGQVLSDYGTWVDSGGASVWGAITGDITDQDDLAYILDGKAPTEHGHSISNVSGLQDALDAKQATLVSGTNIKTIGGNTILGSGDIPVGGGQTYFFLIDI